MPFTPLHLAFVWPILRKLGAHRLTAAIGAMAPDIEIPILLAAGIEIPRILGHSLIGAVTLDPLIAITLERVMYRSSSLRNLLSIKASLMDRRRDVPGAWLASSAGAVTHVAIDFLHHPYNPVFWPISGNYLEGPLAGLMGVEAATAAIHIFSLAAITLILAYSAQKMGIKVEEVLISPRMMYRVFVEPGSDPSD